MVDNAGIGKEVILLQQPALFVMLDYFQLSSYRLWVCAPPPFPAPPGALRRRRR